MPEHERNIADEKKGEMKSIKVWNLNQTTDEREIG